MDEIKEGTEQTLLYDPLFETPPDTVIRDIPGRGFFGKAAVRKTAFVLVLTLFVGVSIILSVSSLSKDRYKYVETDGGWMLDEFIAGKTDTVLEIDRVFDKNGAVQPGKTAVAVREYAVCGNEYTKFIFIGKNVKTIPNNAFYSCTSLQAILVDPENPDFLSDDGVLYRQKAGKATELMLRPARNDLYRALLALGETQPANAAEAEAFAGRAAALEEKSKDWMEAQEDRYPDNGEYKLTDDERNALFSGLKYSILPGVERIGELACAECGSLFEVDIPEGVTDIAAMAFFKCGSLQSLRIPDSVRAIGSDAFSYCSKVPYIFVPANVESIGHHAFYGCSGVDKVYVARAENNAPSTGQDWLPKQRRLFEHNVEVVYGAERKAG